MHVGEHVEGIGEPLHALPAGRLHGVLHALGRGDPQHHHERGDERREPQGEGQVAGEGARQARQVGGAVEGDVPAGEDAGEDGQLPADGHEVGAQRVPLAEHAHEHDHGEQQEGQSAALHERLEVGPGLAAHAGGHAPEVQGHERHSADIERDGVLLQGFRTGPDKGKGHNEGYDKSHDDSFNSDRPIATTISLCSIRYHRRNYPATRIV